MNLAKCTNLFVKLKNTLFLEGTMRKGGGNGEIV